ncbi:DUF1659 domain-containing protein [Ornithinibacillus scapharcae]|uniref:DUF1659 domain-containing protein n=1 Tax=Ornithinibacillus scapharcae TaxID=1147159 RepID=UPI000225B9E7|nr:DUF1659 domain-containing protein [Ornithinibacillus scapharcae]
MAVANLTTSQLRLVFQDGNDPITGKPVFKGKSFNNVKTIATADQLYAIANAFSGLQALVLYNVERKDSLDIHQA